MTQLPDFDTLMALAKHDPEQLETLRQQLIAQTIQRSCTDKQGQLRALQHHVDQQLSRCNTPYQRMITAASLMHDRLHTLAQVLNDPDAFRQQQAQVVDISSLKARKNHDK
ncbi:DUF3135 domain-containing protein [Ferrimonas pelagia]|uniref:DUF3135 domain-containing protein n=1 Tax=Ferrimonas pelagia TaxID=1177826 RepID=A0ABP9F9H8_9GAMM